MLMTCVLLNGCENPSSGGEPLPLAPSKLVLEQPVVAPPNNRPPTSQLLERFDDPDFSVEVSAAPTCAIEPVLGPRAGQRRVEVTVKVTSKSERQIPVGPLTFWLADEGDRRHGATLGGCGDMMHSQRISSGESAAGRVAFDVPATVTDLRLLYEPFLIGRTRVSVPLALPNRP